MITFTNLADSDHSHFAQELFEEAFPEQERPPFSILRQRDAGKFHFLVAENGEDPIGILTYWTFDELVYVEHFAIAEELRNQGLGKAVFLNFLSQQTEQVVLEVELPNTEEADHRVEFYASMGPAGIEARPLWKPMHKQPVYKDAPAYVNGVSEKLFKTGICLPSGPWVTDEDVKYIIAKIKEAIQ